MFIELAEFLRCPSGHDAEPHCVLIPQEIVGRRVLQGVVGCPVCHREYSIVGGVAEFAAGGDVGEPVLAESTPDANVVHALLGLQSAGGYVVLLGSAARAAEPLAGLLSGVHFVGVNAPPGVEPSAGLSLLRHPTLMPLRSAMARGVVIGAAAATARWLAEGSRVLLRGQRLVAAVPDAEVPGVARLATGHGLWVGEKVG